MCLVKFTFLWLYVCVVSKNINMWCTFERERVYCILVCGKWEAGVRRTGEYSQEKLITLFYDASSQLRLVLM